MPGLTLTSGDWQAGLLPSGGMLTGLTFRGTPVLRSMASGSTDPLDSACFPEIPYANRIRGGRFTWQEADVQLPHNVPPESSSLHGLGWQSEWAIESHREFKCALEHYHVGIGPAPFGPEITTWPWAYQAEQRVRLGPKGCAISLGITNRSNVPMPTGLGLHPTFRRRPETRVQFGSGGMILTDNALIPVGTIASSDHFADWARGTTLPDYTIDHCFMKWDGLARIEDDLGSITITARGAPFLHVYAPADGSALCLEPVSHMPDALNQDPAGMIALPPACSAGLQVWIAACDK